MLSIFCMFLFNVAAVILIPMIRLEGYFHGKTAIR